MNPSKMLNLSGFISHSGTNGEIWRVDQDEWCQTNNPGAWPRYYISSTKGYASNPYRSLISAIENMLRLAKNADLDWQLEHETENVT